MAVNHRSSCIRIAKLLQGAAPHALGEDWAMRCHVLPVPAAGLPESEAAGLYAQWCMLAVEGYAWGLLNEASVSSVYTRKLYRHLKESGHVHRAGG